MNAKDRNVRWEKADAADGKETRETYLAGQIPVMQADENELQSAGRNGEKPEPAAILAEDRRKR
jgi:hypothetical protein